MPPRGFRFIITPLGGAAEPIIWLDEVMLGAMDTCCIGMPVLCICGCTACIGLIDCIGRGWPLFICEPPVACKPTAVKPFDPFGPPRNKNKI